MSEAPTRLLVGTVLEEPLGVLAGNVVRGAFLLTGACSCGIAYVQPSRKMRRYQWRTGDAIEHTYRHADGCAGGEHTVIDMTYTKEGSS